MNGFENQLPLLKFVSLPAARLAFAATRGTLQRLLPRHTVCNGHPLALQRGDDGRLCWLHVAKKEDFTLATRSTTRSQHVVLL